MTQFTHKLSRQYARQNNVMVTPMHKIKGVCMVTHCQHYNSFVRFSQAVKCLQYRKSSQELTNQNSQCMCNRQFIIRAYPPLI